MEKQQPFYMVFVEGEKTPSFKHLGILGAISEAQRLTESTGKVSYVLGTIRSVSPQPKTVTEDLSVDELPF